MRGRNRKKSNLNPRFNLFSLKHWSATHPRANFKEDSSSEQPRPADSKFLIGTVGICAVIAENITQIAKPGRNKKQDFSLFKLQQKLLEVPQINRVDLNFDNGFARTPLCEMHAFCSRPPGDPTQKISDLTKITWDNSPVVPCAIRVVLHAETTDEVIASTACLGNEILLPHALFDYFGPSDRDLSWRP